MTRKPIKRALVSVYDKTGLIEIAESLVAAGVEIVSTGSTAKQIAKAGIAVTEVAEVTGFAECLDGRVKTLHPNIHAGILADRRKNEHVKELEQLSIAAFDLVISNLYPFQDTVSAGASTEECIEQIDIGGPTMVRAAAKNYANVAIITSPNQYELLVSALSSGGFSVDERKQLAAQAFVHTANYDVQVANWFNQQISGQDFPAWLGKTWQQVGPLRYGENSHQGGALYQETQSGGLANAQQLSGKAMSYNNYVDTEAALRAVYDFTEPAVAIIKHANPCGIAVGSDVAQAHRRAHACDSVSAFGGVIAVNREASLELANQVAEIFTEVIVAPSYAAGAVEVLSRKKGIRILIAEPPTKSGIELRQISGGLLTQQRDSVTNPGDDPKNWQLMAGQPATEKTIQDLVFAWHACKSVKSNAILLADDGATVGIGMGQVNRVDSCRLAVERAGERAAGAVAASDAFFPFSDGPQILLDAGVRAIVQPGGSIRDQETIEVCKAADVTLYFTGTRHFLH